MTQQNVQLLTKLCSMNGSVILEQFRDYCQPLLWHARLPQLISSSSFITRTKLAAWLRQLLSYKLLKAKPWLVSTKTAEDYLVAKRKTRVFRARENQWPLQTKSKRTSWWYKSNKKKSGWRNGSTTLQSMVLATIWATLQSVSFSTMRPRLCLTQTRIISTTSNVEAPTDRISEKSSLFKTFPVRYRKK